MPSNIIDKLFTSKKTLTRDVFFTATTSGITLIFSIVFFSLLGHQLPVDQFGVMGLALTASNLLSLLPTYGFDLFIIRELVQEKYNIQDVFWSIVCVKFLLSILTLFLLYSYAMASAAVTDVYSFMLFGVAAILLSFTAFLNSVNKAAEHFYVETAVTILQSLTQVLGILVIAYWTDLGVAHVAWVVVFSRLLGLLMSIKFFLQLSPAPNLPGMTYLSPTLSQMWKMVEQAFPFAVHSIAGALYFQIDTLLVAEMATPASIGYYQASMRLITPLMALPILLISAFFPRVASEFADELRVAQNGRTGHMLMHILGISGVLITMFMGIGAPVIITLVYGVKMSPAIPILQVLSLVVLVRFVASGYGLILISSGRQSVQAVSAVIALFINIALNVFLIPCFDAIGAAFTSVITNLVILTIYFVVICVTLRETFWGGMSQSFGVIYSQIAGVVKAYCVQHRRQD